MIAYFDCFSGISGDMTLGALVDLGVPYEWLAQQLRQIPLDGFELVKSTVARHGINATQITVTVAEKQPARHFSHIAALIQNSTLPTAIQRRGVAVFETLGRAEAAVHGCDLEAVHFHEVGGVDAMVDILGALLALDYLKIDAVKASPLPTGTGFVTCDHGVLPLPAPATVAILKEIPVYGTDVPHELVTPTGAAIIKTVAGEFGPLPEMTVERIGYGAGQRNLSDRPNLLRVMLGRLASPIQQDSGDLIHQEALMLECNLDDMNPELFGYLMERLFDDGALDVFWLPVYMKKNRPGTLIQVLSRPETKAALTSRLLRDSTTLGVRCHPVARTVLKRELIEVETRYGTVAAKKIFTPGGGERITPEYESCREIALLKKLPIVEVYENVRYDLRSAAAQELTPQSSPPELTPRAHR